jgi:hypothetical protein
MINASDAWKATHKETVVPESYIEIRYGIIDSAAQDAALTFDNGTTFYSHPQGIVDTFSKHFPKFATLENNMWLLDGSFDFIPETQPYGDTGYVGDGKEAIPTVSVLFPHAMQQLIPGITVIWSEAYGEYATRCRITAWNGGDIIASKEFENATTRSAFEMPLSGYDGIDIEILEWVVPDHHPRIERIYFGIVEIFTNNHLVKYSHEQIADLLSTELPKNEIVFSLDNSSGIWNPDNPQGTTRFLSDRQEINVRYGYKINGTIEYVKAGTFWSSAWDIPSNGLEATFTARDLLEFLDYGYNGPRAGTLYDIALAALTQIELPKTEMNEPRYHLDESLRGITTDFSDDTETYTASVILQMCANAGQCVVYNDRNGVLRIERYVKQPTGYSIGQDISYTHPERTMTKPPQKIVVNDDMWVEEIAPSGEVIMINNPLITTVENAEAVGKWAKSILCCRNVFSGTYRPDPRVDALDIVSIDSKYGTSFNVAVTDIKYDFNGAFHGEYTSREVEVQ